MRTTNLLCLVVILGLCTGCTQLREPLGAAAPAFAWAPPQDAEGGRADDDQPPRRPYGSTRARLQFFREDLEFDEIDADYDNNPDGVLRDVERERTGFRGEFGRRGIGGYFQVFSEQLRAPALLGEEFEHFGAGGGVVGAPRVGDAGPVEFAVPFEFGVSFAGGGENVGGFDADLYYFESVFEVGFGARAYGLQASSGLTTRSVLGWYDTDDPASPANPGTAELSGTNVGAYFEVLYKHERVPLMARLRGVVGDVRGVVLSFGFAF